MNQRQPLNCIILTSDRHMENVAGLTMNKFIFDKACLFSNVERVLLENANKAKKKSVY